jgi:hypothetical protein
VEVMAAKLDADDPRVQWLAEKVCASLGCDVASFTKLMANTPTTYEMKESIEKYLAGKCCGWTCAAPFEPLDTRRVEGRFRWSIRASRSIYRRFRRVKAGDPRWGPISALLQPQTEKSKFWGRARENRANSDRTLRVRPAVWKRGGVGAPIEPPWFPIARSLR